jgi:hypothetical protein
MYSQISHQRIIAQDIQKNALFTVDFHNLFSFKEGKQDKMDLKEVGCKSVDWIHLAQRKVHLRALVNMVMNL